MADNEYIKRSEVVALIEDKLKRCEIVLEALDLASLRTKVMGLRSADVAPRAEVAREIFWEIDKLLARIITDDEAGTQFIGVDMQKYYALKMKYTATTDEPPKGD